MREHRQGNRVRGRVAVSPDGTSVYVVTATVQGTLAILNRDTVPICKPVDFLAVAHNETTPVALSCTDADGDASFLSVVSSPTHGTGVVIPGTGAILYTPTPGYSGVDSFTYKATNTGAGGIDSDTVPVGLFVLDGCAVCAPQARSGQDTKTSWSRLRCGGDPFTYSIVAGPTHGLLDPIAASTGFVDYTPATGFSGNDSFTYRATSVYGTSPTVPFSVSVLPTQQGADGIQGPTGANGAQGVPGTPGAVGLRVLGPGRLAGSRRRAVPRARRDRPLSSS